MEQTGTNEAEQFEESTIPINWAVIHAVSENVHPGHTFRTPLRFLSRNKSV